MIPLSLAQVHAIPFLVRYNENGYWKTLADTVLLSGSPYNAYEISNTNCIILYDLLVTGLDQETSISWKNSSGVTIGTKKLLSHIDIQMRPQLEGITEYSLILSNANETITINIDVEIVGDVPDVLVNYEYTDDANLYLSYTKSDGSSFPRTLIPNGYNAVIGDILLQNVCHRELYSKKELNLC